MNPRTFFAELKRRNVYKVAVAYAVVAWLLIQIATSTFPVLEIPTWAIKLVIALLVLGFPVALILAWALELTPAGIKRVGGSAPNESIRHGTGRWLIVVVLVLLSLAVGLFLFRSLRSKPAAVPADSSRARANANSESATVPDKSIAVLPLENLSEDQGDAFFADGIQDDILTSLAKISDLKVISRTSVMQYRGAARNLREIGQALGVANVLEGSVRRVGNRVLVNVQLIDALHDRHLWAERYDRTLEDSIGLQGELATEIAKVLTAKLAPAEKAQLAVKPTSSPEAYLLYLRAKEKARRAESKQDALEADGLFAQAIALDPAFALACARASILNSLIYQIGRKPEWKAKSRSLVDQALRLAPELGETHLALGYYLYRAESNYAAALTEFSSALASSPNNPDILESLGLILQRQGRWREALTAFDRTQSLDPLHAHLGGPDTYQMLRDWPAAAAGFEHAAKLEPEQSGPWVGLAAMEICRRQNPTGARAILEKLPDRTKKTFLVSQARWDLALLDRDFAAAEQLAPDPPAEEFPANQPKSYYTGIVALARRDAEGARASFERVRELYENAARDHPDDARFHTFLATVYVGLGRKDDAIGEQRRAVELAEALKDAVRIGWANAQLATVYALVGENEPAIDLLERLITMPAAQKITLAELRLGWQWDPLRSDPRFQKILAGPEPRTIYK